MDNRQQEIERLKGRQKAINTGMQTCWFGIVVTSCADAVFHFRFGESWFFIPMMFFLLLLVPLLVYCYIAQGMVKAKMKITQSSKDRDLT